MRYLFCLVAALSGSTALATPVRYDVVMSGGPFDVVGGFSAIDYNNNGFISLDEIVSFDFSFGTGAIGGPGAWWHPADGISRVSLQVFQPVIGMNQMIAYTYVDFYDDPNWSWRMYGELGGTSLSWTIPSAVPLPPAVGLLAGGLAALAAFGRRGRRG